MQSSISMSSRKLDRSCTRRTAVGHEDIEWAGHALEHLPETHVARATYNRTYGDLAADIDVYARTLVGGIGNDDVFLINILNLAAVGFRLALFKNNQIDALAYLIDTGIFRLNIPFSGRLH